MQLEAEIRVSMDLLKYFITHRKLFDNSSLPYWYSLMKFIGATMTEILNILFLGTQTTITNCILGYLSFCIIARIDDMYAMSLKRFPLKSALDDHIR